MLFRSAAAGKVGAGGSGGAIRIEGRNVTNNGILSAKGGKEGKDDRSAAGGGGGAMITGSSTGFGAANA